MLSQRSTRSLPVAVCVSSPLVRRIARENQLNLRQVAGSGSGGRITKEDVLRHLHDYGPGNAEPAQPAALTTCRASSNR